MIIIRHQVLLSDLVMFEEQEEDQGTTLLERCELRNLGQVSTNKTMNSSMEVYSLRVSNMFKYKIWLHSPSREKYN